MNRRDEFALWRALWAKPGNLRMTPKAFEDALQAGASPWYFPQGTQSPKTLLGALCRGHHCDLGLMLSSWIKHAGDLRNPPRGHPPVLCCLPIDASLSAVEKLVVAGADAKSQEASLALFQKAIRQPEIFQEPNFWMLARHLLHASDTSIAQLSSSLGHEVEDLFLLIVKQALPPLGNQTMVDCGGWVFDWARNTKPGHRMADWICKILLCRDVAPHELTKAGIKWSDVTAEGNTLAHCVVIDTGFSYDGLPLLNADALIEAFDQGVSLKEDNNQGWHVLQRIRAVKWSDPEEVEKLHRHLQSRKLEDATPHAHGRVGSPRL